MLSNEELDGLVERLVELRINIGGISTLLDDGPKAATAIRELRAGRDAGRRSVQRVEN